MKRIFLLFFLAGNILNLSAQLKGELKDNFYWGETFILYEEYKDALPLYQLLLKVNPANNNYKYRIGQCLINIPGRKQEAISYLEAAVKDINPKYREGKFKETQAPYDAYYYLANAYRVNNQLEKAIETYEIFKKNLDPKIYDTSVVNSQIESCRNALDLMKLPLYIKKENLGTPVNDQYAEINPVISDDEKIMVFNRTEPFQEALYFTRKINGKWTEPVNIIPYLGLGFEDKNYATSLSADGRELYIYRAGADYDGNIFITRRRDDDTWSNLIKLNDNINTKYWESHAAVSHNGKRLYFTSNRKGSYGGLDIYYSDRDTTGDWGVAKNIGPVINTKYNEESPFPGKDDKTLFFSSRGHFNIGGYDIFYSTLLDNGQWSTPLNVGYPLNSTDDDIFFHPLNEGYQAYYSMIEPGGMGLSDIYRIEIFSKDHPRKFYVRGVVQVKDLLAIFGDSIKVSAINKENPDARVVVYTNPATGEYRFELPQGDYTVTFEVKDAGQVTKNLELSLFNPSDTILIPGIELPKLDLVSEMKIISEKTITSTKGDTVELPVRVEPNSILEVEQWLGDSLIRTDKFIIRDSIFVYKAVPLTGENRFAFKLTDKFSNITTSDIFINRKKITEEKIVRPEYKYVIAQKQVSAFLEMLKNRADDKLLKVIRETDFTKKQFANADEILYYLKKSADRSGIDSSEVDRLALKVAVMDNVLSQSAVNYFAGKVTGMLKDILERLNIYEANLKTWSDLQRYVAQKSGGAITAGELDRTARDVIEGIDPLIAVVRRQILAGGEISGKDQQVRTAVQNTDAMKLVKSGTWLKNFHNEALNNKMSDAELAAIYTALTSLPGTGPDIYLKEFAGYAQPRFSEYLSGIDIKKNSIKTPYDLMSFLVNNRKMKLFDEDEFFTSLAGFIAGKQIQKESMVMPETGRKNNMFLLWIIIGAGIVFFFIIFLKRKRSRNEEQKE